jgi:histone acetyltransferase 1
MNQLTVFHRFEKYTTADGKTSYAFIGYSSVYQFYTYPDLKRPRVAQMLILPPFQKQGLAVRLLSCIYTFYRNDPKVKEITGKILPLTET